MYEKEYEIYFFPNILPHAIGAFVSIASIIALLIGGTIFGIFKKPLGMMVLVVIITDLCFCVIKTSAFIVTPPSDLYCKIMQAIAQVSMLVSVTWSVFFSHVLYTVVRRHSVEALKSNFRMYTIISVVIAVGFGIAIPFTNFVVYSATAQTCVHRVTDGRLDVTCFCFTTLPMTICCGLAIFWYVRAGAELKKSGHKIDTRYLLVLLAYPGIILVCIFPSIIYDLMSLFGDFHNFYVRIILGNLFMSIGTLDALAYGIVPQLREYCNKRSTVMEYKESDAEDIVSSQEYLLGNESHHSEKSRVGTEVKKEVYIQARALT